MMKGITCTATGKQYKVLFSQSVTSFNPSTTSLTPLNTLFLTLFAITHLLLLHHLSIPQNHPSSSPSSPSISSHCGLLLSQGED